MPKMVALVRQRYEMKNISKDEIFTVKDKDVRLLKSLGRVTDLAVVTAMSATNTPDLVPTRHVSTSIGHVDQVESVSQVEEPQQSVLESVSTEEDEVKNEDSVEQSTEFSTMLRNRAMSLGIRVDGRWSDARVQREIDNFNRSTYQTTNMRAEE